MGGAAKAKKVQLPEKQSLALAHVSAFSKDPSNQCLEVCCHFAFLFLLMGSHF